MLRQKYVATFPTLSECDVDESLLGGSMFHIVQGVWEGIKVQAYMFKVRGSNVKAVKVWGE